MQGGGITLLGELEMGMSVSSWPVGWMSTSIDRAQM